MYFQSDFEPQDLHSLLIFPLTIANGRLITQELKNEFIKLAENEKVNRLINCFPAFN